MNLSHLAPKSTHWIQQTIDEIGLLAYLEFSSSVYMELHSIPFSGEYRITDKVDPEAYDIFIKCACRYMDIFPEKNLYMSDDYTTVKRLPYDDPSLYVRSEKKRDLDGGGEFFASGESRENAAKRDSRKAG
jgi:hypothetical protein